MTRLVVYASALNPRWRDAASRGGPMGEILMADALVRGLRQLDRDVQVFDSLRAFAAHAAGAAIDPRPATYFLDRVTLRLAERYHLLRPRHRARAWVLDWFGVPPSRADAGIAPSRYLVPYPRQNDWNTLLGFVLQSREGQPIADASALRTYIEAALRVPRDRVLAWGKEGRYFTTAVAPALSAAAGVAPLHVTIGNDLKAARDVLPAGTTDHGITPRDAWRVLLRSSACVLGLGDPVSGPTALEALLEGSAYLDPRYAGVRHVNDEPDLTIASQHPFAATIGEPFVYAVNLADPATVRAAATKSLDTAVRAREISRLVDALTPFTERAYLARLSALG